MEIQNKVPFSLADYQKGRRVYECVESIKGEVIQEVKPVIGENFLTVGSIKYSFKGYYDLHWAYEYDYHVNLFHNADDNFAKYEKQKPQYYVKKPKA